MRKVKKWLKHNWLAAAIGAAIAWVIHYTVETFIVNNILRLAGFTVPALIIA